MLQRLLFVPLFVFALHAEDQFFESGGVKIHYTVEGRGEPVVLVHGYGANIAVNWAQPGVIKGLAGRYQVIAMDVRGHGQSDKPHDASAYGEKTVEDVVHLMDHLKIRKAHVVGYSMGGFMTEVLLARHSNRLLTATLGGAGWNDPKQTQDQAGVLDQLAQSLELGKGIAPLIIALNPPGAPAPSPQQIEATNKMFLSWNDPLALAACARGMEHLPQIPEAKVRSTKVPVLALIGALDPLKAGVDRLSSVNPKVKVVVIPGATHLTAPNSPVFVQNLKAFLDEHSSQAQSARR